MTRAAIVYMAGSRWVDIPGTDRRLVTALSEFTPVLWVDPPFSVATPKSTRARPRAGALDVAPGVVRLQIAAPPGSSRIGVRSLSRLIRERAIREAVGRRGYDVLAQVVASPRERFVPGMGGKRVLYNTDAWVAGAELMGLASGFVERNLRRNAGQADIVAAVSPTLAEDLRGQFGVRVQVLANGCTVPPKVAKGGMPTQNGALLLGQLNERIDVTVLNAVHAAGISLELVGPRTERLPESTQALDRLFALEGVNWRGAVPEESVPAALASAKVGLTPYADTEFNRASFPLKTLEYLASGLPVVSTDLPSARWLATDLIQIASSPAQFAEMVSAAVSRPHDGGARARRIAFARSHSWTARATQLLAMLDVRGSRS